MSEIPLNKFEKHDLVIKLLKEGKTYREICHIAHIAPRDVKSISEKYEQQKRLENNKRKRNNKKSTTKKLSKCSQAYGLFRKGKTQVRVAIDLNLDFQKVRKYWLEYLRLKNMTKLYNLYIGNEYHLDDLFRIYYFMLRNEIPIKDCENVLRNAHNIINLKGIISNLKAEIEKLTQTKNNYSLNQNTTKNYKPLLPLGLPEYYYRY